ncbi:MAG: DUF520 family protein, partial [Actinobacteria bacterium]|nr:DUF520 family protein [Actinomycetota bacterium]
MANPSFDVVSEVDHQEVINALDQARREVSQRFDFKNTGTTIEQTDSGIEVRANSEGRVEAAVDVIKDKMVKRKVSLKALSIGKIEPAGGANYKQHIDIVHGISDDKARTINKFIKSLGLKVQSQI